MGQKFYHEVQLINDANKEHHSPTNSDSLDTSPSENPSPQMRHETKLKKITLTSMGFLPSKETEILQIKQKHNKQSLDQNLIESCIQKSFFMNSLKRQARGEIIKEMSLAFIPKDTILFEQGQVGNYFYILRKGTLELYINEKKEKTMEIGESFGELALLHCSPRAGTVKAVSDCELWVMERKNFRKIIEHIAKVNFEENKTFIQSIPILANIDHYLQAILCASLIKQAYEPGAKIVNEGGLAHCLFIIKEGEVNCVKGNTIIRTLKRGDNFGERSILVDTRRTMDVVAKTKCVCFSISTATLKNMLGDNFRTFLYLNLMKKALTTSKFFKGFKSYLIEQIFQLFEAVNLSSNLVAFSKGYVKSENIVIIIDGHLINGETNEVVGDRGTILFEQELFEDSKGKINYDLVASPDCLYIKANTQKVISILGGSFKEMMLKCETLDSLSQVMVFRNLPRAKLEVIAEKIGSEKYKSGEIIIKEGETGDKFYIVKKGKVEISVKGRYVRTLNEKEYFGERTLFFKEPRSATIKAVGNVEVYFISQDDFIANIEANMKEHLMNRLYLQDNGIELKDLTFTKLLGAGNFGNVSLVKYDKTKYQYAIKGISRNHIDGERLHRNLELERSILLQIDHPFIVKLVKTLKDKRFIYFLMEYIEGKELFDIIREIGLLSKQQTQFYGASMMLAIEYLHERKFIYRDLKPENIMVLNKTGYLKLIDFGTAKKIIDRTTTIIGTPNYMAPEMILGEGYSFQVDYWSIAICMYEFMCGGVPFGENEEDPMEVYSAIVNLKLSFPPFCKDKEFKQLMTHMLCKQPANRLTKFSQIKNHVWFEHFNWDELMTMNMKPAYISTFEGGENDEEKKIGEGMKFIDYVNKYYKDWESEEITEEISEKKRKEYDLWYENY